MSFVILILSAGAVPGEMSGSGNLTEEPGLNSTEKASRNYFDSDSGLICIAAGKISGYEEIIPADDLVENITFLTDSPNRNSLLYGQQTESTFCILLKETNPMVSNLIE
jgi:hypothetical protein